METMNIALPDGLKDYVQERVSAGGYSSVSEYIRELIRLDQRQHAVGTIDALLLQGIDSWAGRRGCGDRQVDGKVLDIKTGTDEAAPFGNAQ